MIARMPPTNIDASPWTRPIGEPGANQRGPGVPWTRWRLRGPSGPATLLKSSAPRRSRKVTSSRLAKTAKLRPVAATDRRPPCEGGGGRQVRARIRRRVPPPSRGGVCSGLGRQVPGVDDAVGVALLGEEPLAVLREVGVDGVAGDDRV